MLRKYEQLRISEYNSLYDLIVSNVIVEGKLRDNQRIEAVLDSMLDFCFDKEILMVFKKLLRYYLNIDPCATLFYINAYKELWENPEGL